MGCNGTDYLCPVAQRDRRLRTLFACCLPCPRLGLPVLLRDVPQADVFVCVAFRRAGRVLWVPPVPGGRESRSDRRGDRCELPAVSKDRRGWQRRLSASSGDTGGIRHMVMVREGVPLSVLVRVLVSVTARAGARARARLRVGVWVGDVCSLEHASEAIAQHPRPPKRNGKPLGKQVTFGAALFRDSLPLQLQAAPV